MKTYSGCVFEEADVYNGYKDMSSPYSIARCGYNKFITKNASMKRKRVDYYLIYIINGCGYYRLDNIEHKISAGHMILYSPGQWQDYSYDHNDTPELFWIHFTGYAMDQLIEQLDLNDTFYYTGIHTKYIDLFNEIIHEMQVKKPLYDKYCLHLFLNILSELAWSIHYDRSNSFKDDFLESTLHYMHKHYQSNHTVDFYAKKVNLSVYQFIHKFTKITGISPMRYIEKIRIDKSKELLAASSLTITEISDIVGYNNSFYFSRVFKKNTGMTPTIYRTHTLP